MNFATFCMLILIFGGVISIILIICYNNIQAYNLKINEAEGIIDELLRKKYDTILAIKDIILDETDLPEKSFDNISKIKKQNISSFEFERKLTEFNLYINKIISDYDTLSSNIKFTNYFSELNEINQKLEASKSFYNKYTNLLNIYTVKFPSNVIAFVFKINTRPFFDGKDMFDEELKDFKF